MSERVRVGSRFTGVVRIAFRRVWYRINGGSRQTLLSVAGVALAVALLVTVTSIGAGLATQGTVRTANTDYWIVPAEAQGSVVTNVEGTRFGRVHPAATRLEARDDVGYVTPVLFDVVQLTNEQQDTTKRLFVVGIIPRGEADSIVGLPTGQLQPGDPHYANGTYNGTWTGEAVVSESAANLLNVSTGDQIRPRARNSAQPFTVTTVSPAQSPGVAQFPVIVVHLGEAQRLVGAMAGDQADQFLVDTTDPSARQALPQLYPQSEVVSRQGLLAHDLQQSDLPFAMSIAAGLIALIVGTLTITTTVGFEVLADSQSRAVLGAIGVSRSTRILLVATETLTTAIIGGIAGVVASVVAILGINVIGQTVTAVPLAVISAQFLAAGFLMAIVIGIVAVPVVMVFTNRGSLMDALPTQ